jgi:hypothetical protein
MKKIQLSLAALTLVLAIAGTTSVNATKTKANVPFCSEVEPGSCNNATETACCWDEDLQQTFTERALPH